MAADECPKSSQSYEFDQLDSTRKPVSQTLNAFINSPGGGTVYLGVLDTGSISGLLLTGSSRLFLFPFRRSFFNHEVL